ncbi:MAG: response regulator transcription factor [Vampirovibrionales bacterium]|nr:response regulator transcription factor [Vampirovibrionales bacterium]
MRRVLLVDDEQDIVRLVKYNLEQAHYTVFCAYDGKTALSAYREHQPNLIILDLMLPDKPGKEICEAIRQHEATLTPKPRVPVLMLTARASEHDRVSGFEAGADDYVTKPFSPRELVLRVNAMFERLNAASPSASLDFGAVKIDATRYLVTVHDVPITLTPIEFKILSALACHPNVVRSREQLLSDVWADEAIDILDRTVDAHVKRLRDKLLEARDMLETVRGIGYRWRTP